MQLLNSLQWRYATKKFDATKKVSSENIEKLKEAIRLSPSSYGFQPYKILVIENEALREKLKPVSWGQSQITDSSHLFVFCSFLEFPDELVDDYVKHKSKVQGIPVEKLSGYGDFMKEKMKEKSPEIMKHWTAKQSYLALGNLLTACAELQIDSCPIEGFEAADYDEILGLTEKGLTATVVIAIGYRADDDSNQDLPKVRKSKEDLFEFIG